MLHRRFRLPLVLSMIAAVFAVPASAARASFSFARVTVGSVAGTAVRTYAVPSGAVLAGVTWATGSPAVSVRHGLGAWTELDNDPRELGGRPGTEPYWLPRDARALTVRVDGAAEGVRVDFVGAGEPASARQQGSPGWELPRLGTVVTRGQWGADESWRSGKLEYGAPKALVVHHTVTRNDYTQAEAPGLIRAVYRYHTQSRDWDDIGYNVLVDRFGTVYEGRYGGFHRGVVGAHTAGFNAQTTGISLLGNFEEVDTPKAVVDKLARAGAWMAERWGIDPRGQVTLTSKGSPRFPSGARVTVMRIAGHRDLGRTACPGKYAYERLPAVRADAWRRLHPPAVFSAPEVSGAPVRAPRPVTVTARLSRAASWQATITSDDGRDVLATAKGRGTAVSVQWNGVLRGGVPALPGMRFRYTLSADDAQRGPSVPAVGTFEGGIPYGV